MDGVDCDWCLLCGLHTAEGEAYCSEECRSTDLMSSSASSTSSTASVNGVYFTTASSSSSLSNSSSPSSQSTSTFNNNDSYQLPPFVRKQRTSIPNIYAHCTSNPNPPHSIMFSSGASALSHHLSIQQQQQQQNDLGTQSTNQHQTSAATAYPLFYATLNALRPASPSGQQ
ncbi:hypothetical protein BGZ46_004392, partial [Entomortierella lignicola]